MLHKRPTRREFIRKAGLLTALTGMAGLETSALSLPDSDKKLFFKISLAEWSFHKSIKSGRMKNLDFPGRARQEFDIGSVEYVNVLFDNQSTDATYLRELRGRCSDNGVQSLLIMIDEEGDLADADGQKRQTAVERHYRWVDAAQFLGCHSIRVNCNGKGTMDEVAKTGADGLAKLSEYGSKAGLDILVENHGGYSSDPQWLTRVIRSVGKPNCGVLPDFDNFDITTTNFYDRYKGVKELMPFAKKAVSSKTVDFDEKGNCVETDYARMLKIVKDAGYREYLGVEYEGDHLSEEEGIRATIRLLERVNASLD